MAGPGPAARMIGGMRLLNRTPWIALALAPTLLLAACITGAAPAPSPVVPMPEGVVFTQLAVGEHHVCGLEADGVAVCWGRNDEGQLDVPDGMRFRQLTAGRYFSCGLRLEGTLACWGRAAADWPVGESGTWAMVSARGYALCALDADGAAACWGSIAPPPEGPRYTVIGVGRNYGCGLTFAGDLECWGNNDHGQADWRDGPFTALSVGWLHLCALRSDGSAFCQGNNYYGQTQPPDASFAQVVTAREYSCGLTDEGALVCWGRKGSPPAGPFTALSSGRYRICGLRSGGDAVCWEMTGGRGQPLTLNLSPAQALEGRSFDQPVELFPWPGGGLAVAERRGAIAVHAPGTPPRLVLDLTARTAAGGERGLLSAALDPEFDAFPYLYVWYSALTGDGSDATARLSRFSVVDGRVIGGGEELIILELRQSSRIHQGGAIRFAPDGMLYLGIGDNGLGRNAQNLQSLRGAIIRIDVRGASAERPYRVPDDNPLLAMPEARPEIWAFGLRNPWRMNFDAEGRLWVADVGHGQEEEVSLVTAGANLGWPLLEGAYCRGEQRACDALGATPPVATYGRDLGCAIIGGVGSPPNGAYLFGDYCSGRIWRLEEDGASGWSMREIARADRQILGFGRGAGGEVYVLTAGGPILRLELPP